MRGVVFVAVAVSTAVLLAEPSKAAQRCTLGNGIEHIVYIQFNNVHLRRDNPNVPSDLEQIPNLLNFLEGREHAVHEPPHASDLAHLGRH